MLKLTKLKYYFRIQNKLYKTNIFTSFKIYKQLKNKIMDKKKLRAIKKEKPTNKKRKKQKTLAWTVIIITAVNFLLAIAFFVYLYFWVRVR